MHFSAGEAAIIYYVLGGWIASIALAIVNPYLICFLDAEPRPQAAHLCVWGIYVGAGVAVLIRGLGDMQNKAWLIPVFGVPALAISHFVTLLWMHRKLRQKRRKTNGS